MPYYHIKVTYESSNNHYNRDEYELNLSEEETNTVAEQYENKNSVLFDGKWVNVIDIVKIEIRETMQRTNSYFPQLSRSSIFESSQFPNVTRKFIKSPPKGQTSVNRQRANQPLSKNIFIVHGRDHKPMKELKALLCEFGLNPIILHEQPSGSKTIVEKLEEYSDNVGYAFVILTPDDLARSNILPLLPPLPELPFEPKMQARQNVILEFGYFMHLLGRDRVCCLHEGNVELPSDMQGIVYIQFKDSIEEVRPKIKKELNKAGYKI